MSKKDIKSKKEENKTLEVPTKEELIKKQVHDKFEAKKLEMQANMDAQADKIIDKMIKAEELKARLDAAEKKAKEAAKSKTLKKGLEKQKRRTEKAKSIPSADTIELNRKKQLEAMKAIEEKHKLKMQSLQEAKDLVKENKAEKKKERSEKAQTKALNKLHHKENAKEATAKKPMKTIEQEFKAYEAEQKRLKAKDTPKPTAKKKSFVETNPQAVAETRLARLKKKQSQEFETKIKALKALEEFKEAQKKRDKKRLEKRAKYLTKGGIEVPKVKNKVKARPTAITPAKPKELIKYIVVTQWTDREDGVGSIVCSAKNLKYRVKEAHETHMRHPKLGDPDRYIGMFVKDPSDPETYIHEMINDKFSVEEYSRVHPKSVLAAA